MAGDFADADFRIFVAEDPSIVESAPSTPAAPGSASFTVRFVNDEWRKYGAACVPALLFAIACG